MAAGPLQCLRPPPAAYGAEPRLRCGPSTLRAAWWALAAWRATRSSLRRDGLRTVVLPPPQLPAGATRGVLGVLRRVPATCLERSLVLQAWLAMCGEPYDVIIGVSAGEPVAAHAWLAFEAGLSTARYTELTRIPFAARNQPSPTSGHLPMHRRGIPGALPNL